MATDPSPLCCCEFRNLHGQRTHILAFCCECDELDNAVDQCLKGNKVSGQKLHDISMVISDRIRIPWFNGALKLEFDFVVPILFLGISLYFASHSLVLTVLALVYVPVFILIYYIYVLNQRKRTWFFVSWNLASLVGNFILYLAYVASFYSYLHSAVLSLGFGLVLLLYLRVILSRRLLNTYALSSKPPPQNSANHNDTDYKDINCCFCTEGPFIRAKHCRICGYCVPRSDHHCVWTNCCIGQHNHHSFLAAIITFVVTGLWGVYLSFFTICTSKDNSIFHVDCSDVYANSRSSVVFVACWYTIIFSLGMCGLLLQQFVFISLNLTGDEFRRSSKRKSFCEVIRTHNHNKGFIRNWIQFLCPQDIVSISGEVV
ncbi:hypothetical protein pdam_00001352 [Pocillopora damicornis]|uniref:Palmitoyltransferase n=1 Tax=Pocillopora damicornis TaxID=46731 RepID=A0A3M6TLD8_POCDA|nr:palmitoyltransferase ZDHHC23-like [Pocillopora damicornis]RMX42054.1 hypothetical protein pdam_00001352 [Pocillopora damicornis]